MKDIVTIAIWALCGWACYSMAKYKNRNKELWVVLGVLFGVFAVIILSILPNVPI